MSPTRDQLELVTWNLNGLDERDLAPRVEAALQDMLLGARIEAIASGAESRDPPDVLLLQEVTATSFHAVLQPHLKAAGYRLVPGVPPDRSYFELCAVRPPWSLDEHRAEPLWKTQYGRWQHELKISCGGSTWRLFTAHLDSGPEPATVSARKAQVRDIAQQMEGARAIFAGDANLRDPEWRQVGPGLDLVDAWEAAGSIESTRFTWRRGTRRARFDRVWLTPDLTVDGFETIGHEPVGAAGSSAPSDHLGLRVRVRMRPDNPDVH